MLGTMRMISPKEYVGLMAKKGTPISLGHTYELMRLGTIPWIEENRKVKRIPWDDDQMVFCQPELVAP